MVSISTLGALTALIIAIVLILRKVPPVYGMMLGALIGGLVGGANLVDTVSLMVKGAQGMSPAILRILAAGILAGVLIESGAAHTIAETIVRKVGEVRALFALALAALILTAVGVFVDVAVITVAPIALSIAQKADISRMAILLAMIGGGKAGNMMSPNPNTIAVSDSFHVPLTSVMMAGIIPGLCGLIVVYFLAKRLNKTGSFVAKEELSVEFKGNQPEFLLAICAPLIAIVLLSLRPIAGISIDPMVALPVGGLLGALLMGKIKHINQFMISGLARMTPVVIMLIGTGTLAGIIANSELKEILISGLSQTGFPAWFLAPFSGVLMSGATASTTAGSAVASSVFAPTLLELGISSLAGAVMIHTGTTVLDHLPHGSFFHATGGSVNMQINERLKLIIYETLVGLSITTTSVLIFGILNLG